MNNKEYSMQVGNTELKFDFLTWKCIYNSIKQDIPDIEDNFYDSIVQNLKNEAEKLNHKLGKIRDNHDMNGYIATLKSLRETLDLIQKYDWRLMYSEYRIGVDTNDGKSFNQKQIAVWEQNHEGNIRNQKFWNVLSDICECTSKAGTDIGNALKNI